MLLPDHCLWILFWKYFSSPDIESFCEFLAEHIAARLILLGSNVIMLRERGQ
jgi:hypothetical protein